MEGDGSEKGNDTGSKEEIEKGSDELREETIFFLKKKDPIVMSDEETEGEANKERDRSAAFFMPGTENESKGRLKD